MPQKNKLSDDDYINNLEDETLHKKARVEQSSDDESDNKNKNGNGNDMDKQNVNEDLVDNQSTSEEVGCLLICGGVNWDLTGRKELPKAQRNAKNVSATARNLWGPHAWSGDVQLKSVHSQTVAAHSVLVSADGKAYVFGRNDKGQLGLGDLETRNEPVVVNELTKHGKVVSAAVGKNHTLFLMDNGTVYACGDNKMGQCGVGNQNPSLTTPQRVSYSGKTVVKMACGGDFSVLVDSNGSLYTFGSPEYGQLGHNSEGKYFTTGNKIAYNCETVPRKVVVFIEKSREGHVIPLDDIFIKDVACGLNHVLAIDSKKRCFSWGFAGYGRLGHNDTKNEMMPRNLKTFDYANKGLDKIFAGSTFSLGIDENGVLYFWGQTKSTGEATMYPKPIQDLAGWRIRSVACANKSIVVCADESVISWGPSPTFGELGYGENKSKSSTTPQELKTLEGIHVHHVSCGYSHTLFLARNLDSKEKAKIQKLPKWP